MDSLRRAQKERETERFQQLQYAIRIGDKLQSEASRLAEFVGALDQAPHEVRMAAAEVETAVAEWTELRRGWGR